MNRKSLKCYDVFISYRKDYRGIDLGCSIARNLAQALVAKGYTVFYDCDMEPFPTIGQATANMRKARAICVLLSDYFFEGLEGASGYAQELKTAESIYRQGKQRMVFLNINHTFNPNKYIGTDYQWLSAIDYKRLRTDRSFFQDVVHEVQPAIGLKRIPVFKRVRILRFSLLAFWAIGIVSWYYLNHVQKRLVFAGGGTACNYLSTAKGVDVASYGQGSLYLHLPSRSAIVLLAEAAKNDDAPFSFLSWIRGPEGRYEPLVLSTGRLTSQDLAKALPLSNFGWKHKILEYNCGAVEAQILVYPTDTCIASSIGLSELSDLIADTTTFIATTNEMSGTYNWYASVIPDFDSIVTLKRDRGAMGEYSAGIEIEYLTSKTEKWSRVVVLQNDYYNILKIARPEGKNLRGGHDVSMATLVDSSRSPLCIPIYVYTAVKSHNGHYVIDAQSMQGGFLKRLGSPFTSRREVLCSTQDSALLIAL